MNSFNFPYILVLFLTLSVGKSDSDWDYLLFSQRWPNTACTEWKESRSCNFCSLPKDDTHWVIHGLWPTKAGTEGPDFCSKKPFNESTLTPIIDELREYWTNIQLPGKQDSFWRHEWLKHGTCAASLPQLDTELKYFSRGLSLVHDFSIASVLAQNNVVAGEKLYSGDQIYKAAVAGLLKSPSIHCIHEKDTGDILISEIRICIDKNFNLIDCVGSNGPVVNCSPNSSDEVIHYPSVTRAMRDCILTAPDDYPPQPTQHWLYKLLYILKFLVWFSL